MNKVHKFLKSTTWTSRILFFLWILGIIFVDFAQESRSEEIIYVTLSCLVPILIIEAAKNPILISYIDNGSQNKAYAVCKSLSSVSLLFIYNWVFYTLYISVSMIDDLLQTGGAGFVVFVYLAVTLYFLGIAALIEYIRNPIISQMKEKYRKDKSHQKHSFNAWTIFAIILWIFTATGLLVTTTGIEPISECLPLTIFFAILAVIFTIISIKKARSKQSTDHNPSNQ